LALDYEDPLAAALVTRGLPKGSDRQLKLGAMTLTFHFDGSHVKVSNYLDSYQMDDAFHPFFVQQGGKRFKTAPEDGTAFELNNGDRFVIGHCVYVLVEE
jgi:hypothetical protein